ncbi:M48 family peptidase [Streptomyces ipomoeae]|nr:M48 family peptidase [Streptomyces ipomoeae]
MDGRHRRHPRHRRADVRPARQGCHSGQLRRHRSAAQRCRAHRAVGRPRGRVRHRAVRRVAPRPRRPQRLHVIAHELAHVKVAGHQADFWRLVRLALPEYEKRRDELDELGRRMWMGDIS